MFVEEFDRWQQRFTSTSHYWIDHDHDKEGLISLCGLYKPKENPMRFSGSRTCKACQKAVNKLKEGK